jgi:hypothetical protein
MLRLAPTLSAAALLAVMLAAAVPFGAEALFKRVTVKDDVVISRNDARLKGLGDAGLKGLGDVGGIAKAVAAKGPRAI